jgi:hypothetical protein
MDVPFISSGALSRAHYALVRKAEEARSPQALEQLLLAEVANVQRRLAAQALSIVRTHICLHLHPALALKHQNNVLGCYQRMLGHSSLLFFDVASGRTSPYIRLCPISCHKSGGGRTGHSTETYRSVSLGPVFDVHSLTASRLPLLLGTLAISSRAPINACQYAAQGTGHADSAYIFFYPSGRTWKMSKFRGYAWHSIISSGLGVRS